MTSSGYSRVVDPEVTLYRGGSGERTVDIRALKLPEGVWTTLQELRESGYITTETVARLWECYAIAFVLKGKLLDSIAEEDRRCEGQQEEQA